MGGMYGRQGAGICERDGVSQYMTIVSGTLGKAVGNYGGYIAGPSNVIDAIRCFAPSFIFTTALPPHVAAGALEAFNILGTDEGEELRQGQQNNARHLKLRLAQEGLLGCATNMVSSVALERTEVLASMWATMNR